MLGFDLALTSKYKVILFLFSISKRTSSIWGKLVPVDLLVFIKLNQNLITDNML